MQTVKPFSTLVTIIVLALILQTAYSPQYCAKIPQGGPQARDVDRGLTVDYCYASQMRDRNAPLSQWIDTINYDLVLLGNFLGSLFSQIEGIQHHNQ